MRKGKKVGLIAIAAAFLLAGCSDSVEIGPVPTITPRPTVTPAPTPTPVVVVESKEDEKTESVYDTKLFKEYYEKENDLPQLKVAYASNFDLALDVLQIDVTDAKRKEIVKSQFGKISVKEDLSPKVLMDYEASRASGDLTRIALDFSGADVILKFAQENNIPVRGPRLITNETPEWAFTKNFSEAEVTKEPDDTGKEVTVIAYASEDVISKRMENYIKDVITYCNTNYPGVVISWDVLDDAINAADKHELGYRTSSGWYHGSSAEQYIFEACRLARQYATKEQKLYFSQSVIHEDATITPSLALLGLLKEENLIDGVAIQAKYNTVSPNVFAVEDMFKKLTETGLEIQLTEFYLTTVEGAQGDRDKTKEEFLEKSNKRYKNVMNTFLNMEKKSYDITCITFDGLTDDTYSGNQPTEYYDENTGETIVGVKVYAYPYMFDEECNPKDSFFAALLDKSIKAY